MKKCILILITCLIVISSKDHVFAQPNSGTTYNGAIEYYLPQPTTAPPLYIGQPSDISTAYLWLDELMRTSKGPVINKYIDSLSYGDTLKFLAKMLYRIEDDNPISFWQWCGINPSRPSMSMGYKVLPDNERVELQNQIGFIFPDTGRTGFLLACDLISDVTVSDTLITQYTPGNGILNMVSVTSTLNDEIKGSYIPGCPSFKTKQKGATPQSGGYTTPFPPFINTAISGKCLRWQYSPEWQKGALTDDPGPNSFLFDSTGWWVRPSGEYILFLSMAGIGDDTSNQYFTVQPFWGVFGTQGGIYRVVDGHVVDPNDDFGLGASISGGLTVAEWKTRLRARIYNILHP